MSCQRNESPWVTDLWECWQNISHLLEFQLIPLQIQTWGSKQTSYVVLSATTVNLFGLSYCPSNIECTWCSGQGYIATIHVPTPSTCLDPSTEFFSWRLWANIWTNEMNIRWKRYSLRINIMMMLRQLPRVTRMGSPLGKKLVESPGPQAELSKMELHNMMLESMVRIEWELEVAETWLEKPALPSKQDQMLRRQRQHRWCCSASVTRPAQRIDRTFRQMCTKIVSLHCLTPHQMVAWQGCSLEQGVGEHLTSAVPSEKLISVLLCCSKVGFSVLLSCSLRGQETFWEAP